MMKKLSEIAWNGKIFKVIPNLESYGISIDGEVLALPKIREGSLSQLKNMKNKTNKSKRYYKARIIKPTFKQRYWYVYLMHNNIKKHYRVHRLVYITYIGNIDNSLTIDHIDGNTSNNNITNLRAVTLLENCNNPNTICKHFKSVVQLDKDTLKVLNEYKSIKDAMISLGKPYKKGMSSHIGECCNGKRETCYNYKWKWKENL